MAFTVLKTSTTGKHLIEVIGEFHDEHEAVTFLDKARASDPNADFEYTVEPPPVPPQPAPPRLF